MNENSTIELIFRNKVLKSLHSQNLISKSHSLLELAGSRWSVLEPGSTKSKTPRHCCQTVYLTTDHHKQTRLQSWSTTWECQIVEIYSLMKFHLSVCPLLMKSKTARYKANTRLRNTKSCIDLWSSYWMVATTSNFSKITTQGGSRYLCLSLTARFKMH